MAYDPKDIRNRTAEIILSQSPKPSIPTTATLTDTTDTDKRKTAQILLGTGLSMLMEMGFVGTVTPEIAALLDLPSEKDLPDVHDDQWHRHKYIRDTGTKEVAAPLVYGAYERMKYGGC